MEYTITFTQQELQLLQMALGELPLKMSVNLFGKIQQNIQTQDEQQAVSLHDLGLQE